MGTVLLFRKCNICYEKKIDCNECKACRNYLICKDCSDIYNKYRCPACRDKRGLDPSILLPPEDGENSLFWRRTGERRMEMTMNLRRIHGGYYTITDI